MTLRPGQITRHRSRFVPSAAALASAVLVLSGCSPEIVGVTGVTRDEAGGLVGVWQGCDGEELVGATLFRDVDSAKSVHLGEWISRSPSESRSWQMSLKAAPEGWRDWQPSPASLEVGHDYMLVAWRELNVANASGVDFRAEDLDGLQAGKILVRSYDGPGGEPRLARVTAAEFKQMACS